MTLENKRLMVLGAGIFQVSGIRRAVELGCHVISVDYLPDNVGHRVSHQSVNASTTDIAAVLSAARADRIDGIITFSSDVAVAAVSEVAAALDLNGPNLDAAATMTDKGRFRRFQHAHGLPAPSCLTARSLAEIEPALRRIDGPLMIKPTDSSGSRGVKRVDSGSLDELGRAFEAARRLSRSGTVNIEGYLEGTHVSGDGLMVSGRLAFAAITRKYRRGFLVRGHQLPSDRSPDEQRRILAEVERTCRLLDYHDGPLDFDAIVTPDSVWIVEMSPRPGGNGIPELIRRATGFDLEEASIRHALGLPAATPSFAVRHASGSLVFGSATAGVVSSVASEADLVDAMPNLVSIRIACRPGDAVEAFVHGGACLGYAVFDIPDGSTYEACADRIERLLNLAVEPRKTTVRRFP